MSRLLLTLCLLVVFLASVGALRNRMRRPERPAAACAAPSRQLVVQELRGMQYAYLQAAPADKLAIAAAIRHRAAAVPPAALPFDLRNFIETL
jgi:Na+-transporting methylmalonyl-CoA/oxaloacetate decarboxylase gamma subunit